MRDNPYTRGAGMMKNIYQLKYYPVFHAGRKRIVHPELGKAIYSQTSVCYMRFLRKVRVTGLELPVTNAQQRLSGRWIPKVPTHPAHIIVSILDKNSNHWKTIGETEFAPNDRFAGKGLSQQMTTEEMDAFLDKVVEEQSPHRINLEGTLTDCLRIECDREHPVWPNHGECNGGSFNVPFGILQNIKAYGQEIEEISFPVYRGKLEKSTFKPSAPAGMSINTRNPLEVVFCGKKLTIGFSLVRPVITHLAWDCFEEGNTLNNRLFFGSADDNGPSYITPDGDFCARNMTGEVSVKDNVIRYRKIDTGCGITINAVFTVTAESIRLELEQNAERDIPVIEGEAWRLAWNMRAGMTGVAAPPCKKEGRNGFVEIPAMISGDEGGCLLVDKEEGKGMFHTESYREAEKRSTGFVLAQEDTPERPLVIPKGRLTAVFRLKPGTILPETEKKEEQLSEGIRKCWAAGFSAFRPEFGGFSNNSISVNCHVNQYVAFDFAAFTAKTDYAVDPLELVKFSVERALMDGGGYGYHRNLYLDSDPILVSGAGRIFQLTDDRDWLQNVYPGISAAVMRIINNFDEKEGMIVCRSLSGNSGTYRWSSNAMDVVGFGHIDAYVNAWSFRALKNASALCRIVGDSALAQKCGEVAQLLSDNYARQLVNPETGWVSGWRSRDGQLHDFGFIWVNGVACAFRVMDASTTRHALEKLEEKRREVFPESGYAGLPLNLVPIKQTDHMLSQSQRYQLRPSFENYTDGALSPCLTGYYIRALSSNGFRKEAGTIAQSLEQGFADGRFHGPYGTGKEFAVWTGADSGYEGTFGPNSLPLYAIAVQQGIIKPPSPEWWLKG